MAREFGYEILCRSPIRARKVIGVVHPLRCFGRNAIPESQSVCLQTCAYRAAANTLKPGSPVVYAAFYAKIRPALQIHTSTACATTKAGDPNMPYVGTSLPLRAILPTIIDPFPGPGVRFAHRRLLHLWRCAYHVSGARSRPRPRPSVQASDSIIIGYEYQSFHAMHPAHPLQHTVSTFSVQFLWSAEAFLLLQLNLYSRLQRAVGRGAVERDKPYQKT